MDVFIYSRRINTSHLNNCGAGLVCKALRTEYWERDVARMYFWVVDHDPDFRLLSDAPVQVGPMSKNSITFVIVSIA